MLPPFGLVDGGACVTPRASPGALGPGDGDLSSMSCCNAPDGIRTRNLRSLKPLLLGRCSTRDSERWPSKRQQPPRRQVPQLEGSRPPKQYASIYSTVDQLSYGRSQLPL